MRGSRIRVKLAFCVREWKRYVPKSTVTTLLLLQKDLFSSRFGCVAHGGTHREYETPQSR